MIPAIDFDRIAVDMEMEQEDILHLMTIYQEELQKDLAELQKELSSHEWLPVKNKLHKMKGDAANLYLNALASAFAEMEAASLNKEANVLQEQFQQVQLLQAAFAAAFEQYIAEKG